MMNLMLHSLQPSRGAVNFILAQLYIGVNTFTVARPNCRSRPSTPHGELKQVASRLRQDTGRAFALPSYDQVRRSIQTLQQEPKVRKERGEERGVRRERQSPLSFALSIPAPAQLAQGSMSIPWNTKCSRKKA